MKKNEFTNKQFASIAFEKKFQNRGLFFYTHTFNSPLKPRAA